MERLRLSDDAVDRVLAEGFLFNRQKHREIQKMDRKTLERYLANVYKNGFVDGLETVQNRLQAEVCDSNKEEVSVPWEDILHLIGEIKGIGPAKLKAIDQKLREVY